MNDVMSPLPLGLVTEQNRLRYVNDGPHQLMGCKTDDW